MDSTHSVDLATVHVTIYKPTSTARLVNNMSLGPVEAITGEKSLPALTTGSPETSSVWMGHKVIRPSLGGKEQGSED